MVLRTFNPDELDTRNNRQQGLLLLDYLIHMGFHVGAVGDSLVITSPSGHQIFTSIELRQEDVVEYSVCRAKAACA